MFKPGDKVEIVGDVISSIMKVPSVFHGRIGKILAESDDGISYLISLPGEEGEFIFGKYELRLVEMNVEEITA